MLAVLRPVVDRVKLLLAVRAAQELEDEVLEAAAAGRPGALEKLAAACRAAGLDRAAEDLRRRAADLARAGEDRSPQPAERPAVPLPAPENGRKKPGR